METTTTMRRLRNGLIVLIVGAIAWAVSAQAQSVPSILTCYDGNGDIAAQAPVPAPPDFRIQMNAGGVTQAEWTLPTRQKEVLVTTMPCVYFVTQPMPGTVGADG